MLTKKSNEIIDADKANKLHQRQMREMRIRTLDHLIFICEKWIRQYAVDGSVRNRANLISICEKWIRQYRTEKDELQNKSDEDF